MPSTPRRFARLVAAAMLSLAAAAAVIAPAQAASAMQVDCSYIRDLSKYVNEVGVSCAGGSSSPWTGTAGTAAAASRGGICQFHEPDLPDYMARYATSVSSAYNVKTWAGVLLKIFQMKYYDDSGVLYATKDSIVDPTGIHVTWVSDFHSSHAPVEIHSVWTCGQSDWSDPTFTSMFPDVGIAPAREGSAHAGISSITLTSSMRPVPGSTTDQYFYRVDMKSNTAASIEPLTIDIDLRDFSISSIIGLPPGMGCSAIRRTEECTIPVFPSGEARTLTLLLTLRPGTALSEARVSATAEYYSHVRDPLPHDAPLRAVTVAPATPLPAPNPPSCGGSEADPENVVSDSVTTLTAHCTNETGYPMQVTARHGSATIDDFGTLRYSPDPGYVGMDSMFVTSSSAIAVSATTPVEVNVVAPASAADDAFATPSDIALRAETVLVNDHVPRIEGWQVQAGTTPPAHGSIDLDPISGAFTYTPAPGFVGRDSFRYRLSGRNGAVSNVATVTIDVLAG